MKFSIEQIKLKRLHLRKLELSDAKAIYDIFSNADVTRFWSSPQMGEVLEAETFIKQTHQGFRDGNLLQWGIIETSTGRLIGTCAWSAWDKTHKRAEIGFALHPDYWGKGLIKELLEAFIQFGFNELSLHRIEADVDPRNVACIKLLEHLEFRREGYLRERYHLNGEIQDSVIFGLLKTEC